MAAFKKGQPRHPKAGRKPGSTNKIQKAVKVAVLEALNDGAGAVSFFTRLKNSKSAEDRRTFAHIAARLIPHEVNAVVVPVLQANRDDLFEIGRKAAFLLQAAQLAALERDSVLIEQLPVNVPEESPT